MTDPKNSRPSEASTLSQPMKMLLCLPETPILAIDAARTAGLGVMPARKAGTLMSVLVGRSLVDRVGLGTYQITPLGRKVQAKLNALSSIQSAREV